MGRFLVNFEATGFTDSQDVVGQSLGISELKKFSWGGSCMVQRPVNFVSVRDAHISEDDGQGKSDIKVFICIGVEMELKRECEAMRTTPDREFLGAIARTLFGKHVVDMDESTWEVSDVDVMQSA